MDYENSTHVRDWTFTPKQLEELRTRSNYEAQGFIMQLQNASIGEGEVHESKIGTQSQHEINHEVSKDPTLSMEDPRVQIFAKSYGHSTTTFDPTTSSISDSNAKFITPQEELTLLNFYCSKLLPLIGPSATIPKLKRDIKVASTAAVILKRFYLSNSVLLFDPKVIMVASAFLASKIEDATVDVRYLEDGTRSMQAHVKIKEILEAEVKLIKGIDFDLCCYHPYKVVLAFTEDLRTFLKSKDGRQFVNTNKDVVSGEDLRPIYDLARDIVERLIFNSDVMLVSSPGKIGFVAMMLANEKLTEQDRSHQDENVAPGNIDVVASSRVTALPSGVIKIDYRGYLKSRFAHEKKEQEIETLWSEIIDLFNFMKKSLDLAEPDMTILKGIHKKLKKCRQWGKDETGDKRKKKKRKHDE